MSIVAPKRTIRLPLPPGYPSDIVAIPFNVSELPGFDCKAILEAMGVTHVSSLIGCWPFRLVRIPAGWRIEQSDHPMHWSLRDARGRNRADIFYKPAGREGPKAYLTLLRRYTYTCDVRGTDDDRVAIGQVIDGNDERVIFETGPRPMPQKEGPFGQDDYEIIFGFHQIMSEITIPWLNAHYPEWRDPCAYWDDD